MFEKIYINVCVSASHFRFCTPHERGVSPHKVDSFALRNNHTAKIFSSTDSLDQVCQPAGRQQRYSGEESKTTPLVVS